MWLIVNSAIAAAAWFGYEEGIEGAKNVALFAVWLSVFLGPLALSDSSIQTIRKSPPPLLPAALTGTYRVVLIAFLVWHGAWVTAVFYACACICFSAAKHKAKELGPLPKDAVAA